MKLAAILIPLAVFLLALLRVRNKTASSSLLFYLALRSGVRLALWSLAIPKVAAAIERVIHGAPVLWIEGYRSGDISNALFDQWLESDGKKGRGEETSVSGSGSV